MDYRIEVGGVVVSGDAEAREVAALARELSREEAAQGLLALPAGRLTRPSSQGERVSAPPSSLPTFDFTLPGKAYERLAEFGDIARFPHVARRSKGGTQYTFTLTAPAAVELYEFIVGAIGAGGGKGASNVYAARRNLAKVLDDQLGVKD